MAFSEGEICWVDAVQPDLEEGKRFYGEVLGWTFGETQEEHGSYTQAFTNGKNVAAIMPAPPGGQVPAAWTIYFYSSDAAATAERIREAGGRIVVEPMQVAEFGTMVVAADPAGAVFGVWQPGTHPGFETRNEPGAIAWAEIAVPDADAVDEFYPKVFPFALRAMGEPGSGFDYKVAEAGGQPVIGRLKTAPGQPPRITAYFSVSDCDDAVAAVRKLGGTVRTDPQDSPFGRNAVVADSQGAEFVVIDTSRTVGEPPAGV